MKRVDKSITIKATIEKVFGYITDPINQIDWMPSMVNIMDVSGSGLGKSFRWTYKMAGILLDGESTYTEYIPNKRVVTLSKGGAESTFIFDFEPHSDGTMLKLVIEYTIPIPVIGKIGEAVLFKRNEREADLAMANIKERLEG